MHAARVNFYTFNQYDHCSLERSLPVPSSLLKHPNENLMLSFGRLRQQIAPEDVPLVQYDSFSSFNQSDL